MEKNYNGWTNYATWRINLEMISDQEFHIDNGHSFYEQCKEGDAYKLSKDLEEYVLEDLAISGEGLAYDYACAFVAEVNFYEIAEHIIYDYNLAHCDNCNEPLDYDTSLDGFCSKECKKEEEVLSTFEKG